MGVTWNTGTAKVYTEVSGTISFNTPTISKVYVDWDDGIDNSLEYGIYQWKTLEGLSDSITLSHTYTATGSFTPVVRTINSQGYLSKYFYTGTAHSNVPSPKEEVTGLNSITIQDDKPLATLKVENKVALSGIDNNVFQGGPLQVYIVSPALADGANGLNGAINITFEVEAQVAIFTGFTEAYPYQSITKTYTISGNLAQFVENEETLGNPVCYVWVAGIPTDILAQERILKILSFRLKTPKLSGLTTPINNEFNKMRFFLTAEYPADSGEWYPITYVSSGNPIKKLNDSRNRVTLDFGQSRGKASNVNIASYNYDTGKSFFEPLQRWTVTSSVADQYFTNSTYTVDSVKNIEYTYTTRPDGILGEDVIIGKKTKPFASGNGWFYTAEDLIEGEIIRDQFLFNDFNQLTPRYHLTRDSCTTDPISYTSVVDAYNAVYRITPTISTSATSGSYLDQQVGGHTAVYTDEARKNADVVGDDDGQLHQIGMDGWNTMGWQGDPAPAKSEYLVLGDTQKTNRIFFQATPYASGMMTDLSNFESGTKMSISYLRKYEEIPGVDTTETYEWVPVEFKDGTAVSREYRDSSYESAHPGEGTQAYTEKRCSLVKPGFVEFDMPSDWEKVSISDLAMGLFNSGSVPVPVGTPEKGIAISCDFDEILYAGGPTRTVFDVNSGILGGTYYNEDIIGKYKYVFQITGGTAGMAGNLLWIASGSDSSDKITCPGNKTSVTSGSAGTAVGYIRRVNLYEVFDGAWPYDDNDGLPGHLAGNSLNYYCTFMFLSGTAAMATDLATNFKDVYPLKVGLLGNHFEVSGTGEGGLPEQTGLELWNIIPANSSHCEIVKEIDNTAYDLNYMEITSDVGITYAGTYYQAITKGGKVFIQRTGTPIQTISFGGNAMGDETQFSFSSDYTSYYTLYKLRKAEAEGIRVMWDEQQKDGTYVRFFGFVSEVSETHKVSGKRASKAFSFTMPVEEICIIDELGNLISDIEPLGGIRDARTF